jgi:hypothetical protein
MQTAFTSTVVWWFHPILGSDEVILTNSSGRGYMIRDDNAARVWVEEVSPGNPRRTPRYLLIPNFTQSLPAPSYPTPAPTPTPKPIPAPTASHTPARDYKNKKWPDGRILTHPEHFVNTGVVNVSASDTLKLRSRTGNDEI